MKFLTPYIAQRFASSSRLSRALSIMNILAVVGITLAVATLSVTVFLSRGFEKAYKDALLGFNAHILVMADGANPIRAEDLSIFENYFYHGEDQRKFAKDYNGYLPLWNAVRPYAGYLLFLGEGFNRFSKKMDEISLVGVDSITPYLYKEGLAISKGNIAGIIARGVDLEKWFKERKIKRKELNAGKGVYLGRSLYEKLGSPEFFNLIMQGKKGYDSVKVEIAGIFESGLYDFDSQFVVMEMEDLRRLFNLKKGNLSGVELMLDDPVKAYSIAESLKLTTANRFSIFTWDDLNSELFKAIALERKVFSFIMALLLIVASFNIIALTTLLILNRRFDIALLKAMGMRSKKLRRIFLIGSLLTGITGTIFGIALSLGVVVLLTFVIPFPLDEEIYFIKRVPFSFSYGVIGGIAFFSLLVVYIVSRFASKGVKSIDVARVLQDG